MTEPKYDKQGRMRYHPEFHFKHRIPFTEEELEYLCKFYEMDGMAMMAYAIGKTETAIAQTVAALRSKGLFEQYKRKWDERYARAQA